MFKVYWCNLGKAIGVPAAGKRPVVVVGTEGNRVYAYPITSRNRNDMYHARMNPYMVKGYCDVGNLYTFDRKYMVGFVRSCTLDEEKNIKHAIKVVDSYNKTHKNV